MKRLAFIESSDIGVAYSAEAARSLGFEPVFICDLTHYAADPLIQLNRELVIDTDTSSVENILNALPESLRATIAGVLTLADSRLLIANGLAQRLGVPGVDPSVVLLKDKSNVAALVPESSPESQIFSQERIPYDILQSLLDQYGSIFIKPKSGAGALGAFRLDRRYYEPEKLMERLLQFAVPAAMGEGMWVAQPYLEGELVSLEGYVHEGQLQTLGFTNRRKIGATESAARFPVDREIPEIERNSMIETTQNLVHRSGFRNGYFHNEYIRTSRGAQLIDANMGRIGGGAIAQQIAIAYRLDPVQVFRHLIELAIAPDHAVSPYGKVSRESYAILYGVAERETIQGLEMPELESCYHTRLIGDGANVARMGENDWSWVGILSGPTNETLSTIQKIKIKTRRSEVTPWY